MTLFLKNTKWKIGNAYIHYYIHTYVHIYLPWNYIYIGISTYRVSCSSCCSHSCRINASTRIHFSTTSSSYTLCRRPQWSTKWFSCLIYIIYLYIYILQDKSTTPSTSNHHCLFLYILSLPFSSLCTIFSC